MTLATAYFGEDVLMSSSPAGKGVNARLDYRVLAKVEGDVKKKFGPRVSPDDFPDFVKISMKCLATRCKNLKSREKDRASHRRVAK